MRSPHEIRFAELVEALRHEPNVSHDPTGGRRFGHSVLAVNGKIFAMVSSAGAFVVKLPRERVALLEGRVIGKKFEAGGGRRMKEWLALDAQSTQPWLPLAQEALDFVRRIE